MSYLPALLVGGPKDGVVWYIREDAPEWEVIRFPQMEDPNLPGCCLMYRRRATGLPFGGMLIIGIYNGVTDPEAASRVQYWLDQKRLVTMGDAKRMMEQPPSGETSKRILMMKCHYPLHDGSALTLEECERMGMKVKPFQKDERGD